MEEFGQEVTKRLEALKKSAAEFSIFLNSLESKRLFRETEISALDSKIQKLKSSHDEHQARANKIMQDAQDETSKKVSDAKKLMQDALALKEEALKEKNESAKMANESKALLAQAMQRQKEADIAYTQNEERKKKLMEAVR